MHRARLEPTVLQEVYFKIDDYCLSTEAEAVKDHSS